MGAPNGSFLTGSFQGQRETDRGEGAVAGWSRAEPSLVRRRLLLRPPHLPSALPRPCLRLTPQPSALFAERTVPRDSWGPPSFPTVGARRSPARPADWRGRLVTRAGGPVPRHARTRCGSSLAVPTASEFLNSDCEGLMRGPRGLAHCAQPLETARTQTRSPPDVPARSLNP